MDRIIGAFKNFREFRHPSDYDLRVWLHEPEHSRSIYSMAYVFRNIIPHDIVQKIKEFEAPKFSNAHLIPENTYNNILEDHPDCSNMGVDNCTITFVYVDKSFGLLYAPAEYILKCKNSLHRHDRRGGPGFIHQSGARFRPTIMTNTHRHIPRYSNRLPMYKRIANIMLGNVLRHDILNQVRIWSIYASISTTCFNAVWVVPNLIINLRKYNGVEIGSIFGYLLTTGAIAYDGVARPQTSVGVRNHNDVTRIITNHATICAINLFIIYFKFFLPSQTNENF